MSFDYQAKKPEDITKINSNEMGELLWWSYILGTYPEKILAAIDEVGSTTEQVKKCVK